MSFVSVKRHAFRTLGFRVSRKEGLGFRGLLYTFQGVGWRILRPIGRIAKVRRKKRKFRHGQKMTEFLRIREAALNNN